MRYSRPSDTSRTFENVLGHANNLEKHLNLQINALHKEISESSLIISVIRGNKSLTRFQCRKHHCSLAIPSAQCKGSADPLLNSMSVILFTVPEPPHSVSPSSSLNSSCEPCCGFPFCG